MGYTRVAVVTGGGSGIGRATAVEMAKPGLRVAVLDRSREALIETTSGLGASAQGFPVDIGDPAQVERAIPDVLGWAGRIDVVVNSAGQICPGLLGDLEARDAERTWRVNVLGPALVTRAALPALTESAEQARAGRSSVVVNVTTSTGGRGWSLSVRPMVPRPD